MSASQSRAVNGVRDQKSIPSMLTWCTHSGNVGSGCFFGSLRTNCQRAVVIAQVKLAAEHPGCGNAATEDSGPEAAVVGDDVIVET